MILDSGKTLLLKPATQVLFESVVILDSGKTVPSPPWCGWTFESVVILDSGKTSTKHSRGGVVV